jgi:hypothetical protein
METNDMSTLDGQRRSDPLIGQVVELPGGERAQVLDIEHEYDDGATLKYLSGRHPGALTMRDTYAVRKYPVVLDWPLASSDSVHWRPAVALPSPRHWPWLQRIVDRLWR